MTNILVGLFEKSDAAQQAIQDLLAAGIDRSAIDNDVSKLSSMGVPAREAGLYAQGVQKGGALVTVRADASRAQTIQQILDRDGALDIDAGGDKLEIVEERLQVGKREVERGGVRVRSFVTEKPVSEQVTLREEHVDVQRAKVDRPATEADFQTGTIEMTETAEIAVVAKEARVVEEISLSKTASEHVQTVTDTIRRMDFEVENVGSATTSASTTVAQGSTEFESHLSRTAPGAKYERHAPAFEYGQQLARDPAFGSSEWSSNEATYRSRWEARNPGTWDEFKGSVKHAFEVAKSKVSGH